ncbi:MAG: DUF4150 domain-containing protein [Polyangiaceae bacterium]|nr:DUF4150 domain-containing protein [Polyangiaceae bacterium]
MGVTINVNGLSLCHRGSGGISTATLPDVCKTPPGPLPVPYPNVALSKDLARGTTTVFADGGHSVAHRTSELAVSTGDEPGTAGGVISGTFAEAATWITFSPDVKIEGQCACRLTDKMFHNHRNTVNAGGLLQAPLGEDCNTTPTPAPPEVMCHCDYYQFRHDDFVERMGPCGKTPPDYYLDYGLKYCNRFTAELRPKLSDGGKAWLDRARCLLQEYMEDGLMEDPSIEGDSDKFREFAFETHPDAYVDAGLHEISAEDKLEVALTPDMKEWLSADTWEQAFDVALEEGEAYAVDAVEGIWTLSWFITTGEVDSSPWEPWIPFPWPGQ